MIELASMFVAGAAVFALGGVVFGFSSLYPLLYHEGVLVDVCGDAASGCEKSTTKVCLPS